MIRVSFTEPATAQWLRWRRDVKKAVAQLVLDFAAKKAITISDALYKRRKDVIFDAFAWKCAYCESNLKSQHGDVEHYRPKKAVTDLTDNPVSLQVGGQAYAHPGYFWVAYDFANLIPSCAKCNQQPKRRPDGTLAGKGNRFPVAGTYGYNPADPIQSDLTLEQPLLLHPVYDEPSDHLIFLPDTGALGWKTVRGEKTIDVCDLNQEWLCDERRKIFEDVTGRFLKAAAAVLEGNATKADEVRQYIENVEDGTAAYAFAGRAAIAFSRAKLRDL